MSIRIAVIKSTDKSSDKIAQNKQTCSECFVLQSSKAGGGSGGGIYIESKDLFKLLGKMYNNGGSSSGYGGGGAGGRLLAEFQRGIFQTGYVQSKGLLSYTLQQNILPSNVDQINNYL